MMEMNVSWHFIDNFLLRHLWRMSNSAPSFMSRARVDSPETRMLLVERPIDQLSTGKAVLMSRGWHPGGYGRRRPRVDDKELADQ
jgi:hypothetical protein